MASTMRSYLNPPLLNDSSFKWKTIIWSLAPRSETCSGVMFLTTSRIAPPFFSSSSRFSFDSPLLSRFPFFARLSIFSRQLESGYQLARLFKIRRGEVSRQPRPIRYIAGPLHDRKRYQSLTWLQLLLSVVDGKLAYCHRPRNDFRAFR